MYAQVIYCKCGQVFYCTSIKDTVLCPKCKQIHTITEETEEDSIEEQV